MELYFTKILSVRYTGGNKLEEAENKNIHLFLSF